MEKIIRKNIQDRTYQFSLELIKSINVLPQNQIGRIISNQLIRSGTSIGANVVEAKAASSRIEFKRFYEIALKSAHETIYWFSLLRDSNIAPMETTNNLLREVSEITKILGKSVMSLKGIRFERSENYQTFDL